MHFVSCSAAQLLQTFWDKSVWEEWDVHSVRFCALIFRFGAKEGCVQCLIPYLCSEKVYVKEGINKIKIPLMFVLWVVINILNQKGASGSITSADLVTDPTPYKNYVMSGTFIRPFTVELTTHISF